LKYLLLIVSLCFIHSSSLAQQLSQLTKTQFGRTQLLNNYFQEDTTNANQISPLPFYIAQTLHSKIPYPSYNGYLANAKGYGIYLNTGFFLKYRFLELKLSPEYTEYLSPVYEGFSERNSNILWGNRYAWWNQVDLPENTFETLQKFYWGQSYVGININKVRLKISTENMWWGAGKHNALIISTNAPGIPHVSISTVSPLSLGIGSISFNSITGILSNSGLFPPDTSYRDRGMLLYVDKPEHNRFISGIDLKVKIDVFKGLTLGLSNVTQQYQNQLYLNDYISSITSLFLIREGYLDNVPKQQLRSFYFNYLMSNIHLELYGERIKQNPRLMILDAMNNPERESGFLLGLEKAILMSNQKSWIVGFEVTKLSQNPIYAIENASSIYLDPFIRQGFTHMGELIGANLGPGSNQQLFSLAYIDDQQRVNLELQRLVRELDFYYFAFSDNKDFRRFWVDMSAALSYQHAFKSALVHFETRYIYSINYQWEHDQNPDEPYFAPGRDLSNWQVKCNVLIPISL
jgi:hypothetical protein